MVDKAVRKTSHAALQIWAELRAGEGAWVPQDHLGQRLDISSIGVQPRVGARQMRTASERPCEPVWPTK